MLVRVVYFIVAALAPSEASHDVNRAASRLPYAIRRGILASETTKICIFFSYVKSKEFEESCDTTTTKKTCQNNTATLKGKIIIKFIICFDYTANMYSEITVETRHM